MFCEIILPLPLYSTFCYSVPDEYRNDIQIGSRVLVQFGKKKYYTGIVDSIHNNTPDYDVKQILGVLDARPVVRFPQLKFWKWMSQYYLCSEGEVYRAGVPTGLKPESETYVTLNDDFDSESGVKLTERQAIVIQLLEEKKRLKIYEIEQLTKISNIGGVINSMLELGLVWIDEKVVEKYRAKKVTVIELCADRGDHQRLHELMDLTRRSQLQEKTIVTWLDMSGWLHPVNELKDVERKELIERAGVSAAVLRALVDKGVFKLTQKIINRFNQETPKNEAIVANPLSTVQNEALKELHAKMRDHQVVLLHGVTGSGKTEIYTQLIADTLQSKRQVLYLVPEISLTTQLTDRLRKVFGNRLLVYHSKFSDSERVDIWKRLFTSHEPLVILGARSSIFLPFAQLGLVIVDEEHESSYKQYDPAPRYNARDSAIMLASMHGAKVVLGSATPSIETYFKSQNGKYGLVTLTERYKGASLPEVEIVDMRIQRKKKLNTGIFSSTLLGRMRQTLKEKKQSIVFQNRRGFAPIVVCKQCGWTPKCENCDVSLVYHKRINTLKCHYCGFSRQLPNLCPACGENAIEVFGYGTERIADEISEVLPDVSVVRMDLDTTRNKDAYQDIIEKFARHDTDVLVGTQMVSKGLDFDDVVTVGVINADTVLNFPDFRSSERAFNMLEQVAGRAGRREDEGKVVIQTSNPANPVLSHVKHHDFDSYYKDELDERRRFGYPPFTKVITIYLRSKDRDAATRGALLLASRLRDIFGNRVLGPEKPFVARVALWYIESIMLKVEVSASMVKVKEILRDVYTQLAVYPDIKKSQIYYDVDPM